MIAYMETANFLNTIKDMSSEEERLAFERATKIPAFEVGRVNLTGIHSFGTGDNLSVSMNNVQFFKNSTSNDPKIWATKDVAGSYTTTAPTAGVTSVPLSATGAGGTNFDVNFKFQQWNSGTTNTWGATVNGTGTLNRTDSVGGTVGVNMNGGAAGKISGTSFTGTGAGIAKPLQTSPPVN